MFWFVTFSPDGKWLAAYNGCEGDLNVWRVSSWEEIEAEEERLESEQSPGVRNVPKTEPTIYPKPGTKLKKLRSHE